MNDHVEHPQLRRQHPMMRILILLAVWFAPFTLLAQNTLYVRSGGADSQDGKSESSAKKTLQAAITAAENGDIIDVGPGSFAGATINKGVVIQGANANYDIAKWDVPTVITSTLTMAASASSPIVTLVGLQFGPIVPLAGTCENANITIYNCKFIGAKPISASGAKWAELFVTASVFDAKAEGAKPGTAASVSALTGGDVGIMVVRENSFKNYTKAALDVAGSMQIFRASYNEFSNCNASADPQQGAVRCDASKIEQEVTIENSLFTGCAPSVVVSGTIAGKTVAVKRNSFRQTPANAVAVKNLAPTALDATCNAFNVPTKDKDKPLDMDVIAASIRKLVTGSVTISPTNLNTSDADGDAIGFEPEKDAACATTLP
jgi:hypothetical protein